MKHIENYIVNKTTAAFVALMTMSNTALAAGGGLSSWTIATKLKELGEWFISDVALPICVLGIIGLGIAIMRGNAGQFTGQAVRTVAGLSLIAAAGAIAAWIIGK